METITTVLAFQDMLLSANRTPGHFKEVFRNGMKSLGFETFTFALTKVVPGTITAGQPTFSGPPFCITTWEAGWQSHYQTNRFYDKDTVFQAALRSVLPVNWADHKPIRKDDPAWAVFSHAEDAGFNQGITIPIHGPENTFGLISVTSSMNDKEFSRQIQVHQPSIWLMAMHFYQAVLNNLNSQGGLTYDPLTTKEREVLIWVSYGKNNAEVAAIMGIAVGTVRFHIANACAKLKVSNRIQAAVKASQLGILFGSVPVSFNDTNPSTFGDFR
ncbi:helix-turn-helix transcriptional regulator [Nitrospirillum amazonense]|uniref:helix-turn-helix transcriptional regulator n=1 Tax=Nitrospirillum amazonense TaxID=28077 RepID=UPI0024124B5F|nr:LuxR family transcriptional regulator [Nitrospirillum amazonense]MDG3444568.1 LuxR family transcriptional regulator [Nitrospirillum amazonense]